MAGFEPFFPYAKRPAKLAWSSSYELDEIQKGSYLAVALNGHHGDEGAYAAMRIDNIPVGAPDRAVSYPSNTWEYYNVIKDSNYTYYFPLSEDLVGKKIDVVVLVMNDGTNNFQPEVYLTAHPIPFVTKELILFE